MFHLHSVYCFYSVLLRCISIPAHQLLRILQSPLQLPILELAHLPEPRTPLGVSVDFYLIAQIGRKGPRQFCVSWEEESRISYHVLLSALQNLTMLSSWSQTCYVAVFQIHDPPASVSECCDYRLVMLRSGKSLISNSSWQQ